MKTAGLCLALVLALLARCPGVNADMSPAEEDIRMSLAGGAWHPGKFVPCADGVVTSVHPRLDEPAVNGVQTFGSGVGVEIKLPTAPRFLNGQPFPEAAVVHYDHDIANELMQSEKPGDKVQVCLVSFPTPTHDLQTGKIVCDPETDPRGMVYRVYDYKRHGAYMGPDSEHGCGGA